MLFRQGAAEGPHGPGAHDHTRHHILRTTPHTPKFVTKFSVPWTNSRELPKDHGYPVRVVTPGITGARAVKWVRRIVPARRESQSQWQQKDYKSFNPGVGWDDVDWSSAPAIQVTMRPYFCSLDIYLYITRLEVHHTADYKLFNPGVGWDDVDWSSAPAIQVWTSD